MLYLNQKGINDIIAFAENTLNEPNLVLSVNNNVTTHKEAKWIINKLKYVVQKMEHLSEVTDEPIKYPLTEGTVDSVSNIKRIQAEHDKANEWVYP